MTHTSATTLRPLGRTTSSLELRRFFNEFIDCASTSSCVNSLFHLFNKPFRKELGYRYACHQNGNFFLRYVCRSQCQCLCLFLSIKSTYIERFLRRNVVVLSVFSWQRGLLSRDFKVSPTIRHILIAFMYASRKR